LLQPFGCLRPTLEADTVVVRGHKDAGQVILKELVRPLAAPESCSQADSQRFVIIDQCPERRRYGRHNGNGAIFESLQKEFD
jgi:hypothetical protein